MDTEKLKQKILDLAIRGKLVPQDPNDESAEELIKRIQEEKAKLVKEGKIKASKEESVIFKGSDNCYYEKKGSQTNNITDEIPFEIPENWAWARLSTISKMIGAGGDRPAIVSKTKTNECNIPIYSNGIDNNGLYGYTNTPRVFESSVTVSARGTIGFSCVRIEPFVPIVRLLTIIPYSLISLDYLSLFLNASYETGSGTSIPQLTVPTISRKLIAIPPINEQIKIAELKTSVGKYLIEISNIYKSINDVVDKIKSKILDSIFNDDSSYKSYYQIEETTLSELIPSNNIGDGDWVLSSDMDEQGEYSLVQLKHIGNYSYCDKSYKHVNSDFFKTHKCTEIKEDFILINRLIAENMNVCMLPCLPFKCITAVDVCWIAPSDKYNQKYLMYYLLSPTFQSKVKLQSSGTTRKRISKTNLIKIPMLIHKIEHQKQIVEKIENMFKILDSIIS